MGYLLLAAVILSGCGNDEANKVEADSVEAANSVEKEQATVIEELEVASNEKDIIKFARFIEQAKEDELVNKEIIDMSDSFLQNFLDEKDYKTFRTNSNEVHMINSISIDNKDLHKPILKAETKLKLDEMEKAIINKDFITVENIYEGGILIDHAEASAMYAYATYLQTEPKSLEASATLGLAVKPNYFGKLRDEIIEGITDTSYISLDKPFITPFIESDWKYMELTYESKKETIALLDQNKAEGEIERADAIGQNPSIGMTAGQVEVSLWGKPESVNRTVTEYGVREQWIYGNGQYLYFEDGILTSFQD